MINNKRGGEKLFSIWWFLILGITAVGIGYGVVLFYSQDIDIREFETGLIYSHIGNCIVHNNVLVDEVLNEDFDIYSYCHIDKKVFEESFYLNLVIKDDEENIIKEISIGNLDLRKQCEIVFDSKNTQKVIATSYARCYSSKESISYFDEGYRMEGSMEFLSASNNAGKRISII